MRVAGLALLMSLLATSCVRLNRCKNGTLLVGYSLGSDGAPGTELIVTVSVADGPAKVSPATHAGPDTTGTIEIDFPNGYPEGQKVDVWITGHFLTGDRTGQNSAILPAGCTRFDVDVSGESGDLAAADLAAADLGMVSSDAAVPLVIRGIVRDAAGTPIANASVMALDINTPVTLTAHTDGAGAYELRVPATVSGVATFPQLSLYVRARGYDTFPKGIRRSLPISLTTPTDVGGKLVVQSAATDVVLFAVPNPVNLGWISGTVSKGAGVSAALVLADGAGVDSGYSDVDGHYDLFNLPPGSYTVSAYAADAEFVSVSASVTAGAATTNVNPVATAPPLGAVTGDISITAPTTGTVTSILLVLAKTYNDATKRADAPPGLRLPRTGAPNVGGGAFRFDGVPKGGYVVLAGFENDALVLDPDPLNVPPSIGVTGSVVALSSTIKLVGAIDVVSPGATDIADEVMGTPTFKWTDTPTESGYTVEAFDANGMSKLGMDIPGVQGGTPTYVYNGMALTVGQYYRFKITAFKDSTSRIYLTTTEDLRGIFIER